MARSGFEVQKVTVEALFLREIRTRFGKFRLGYLWAILEPSAHLLILLGIFGYIMHRTMPDISFPVFLLNGLIPFFIFSSISNRSVGAIEANLGLFNYRPVKPIDTIIARALLETLIYVAVYILLMLIVWMALRDAHLGGDLHLGLALEEAQVEDVPLPVGEAVHGLLEGDVLQPALVGIL